MNRTQAIAPSFDLWLTRLTQTLRAALQRQTAAARAQRQREDAAHHLRERIAQYESQQPGYAADLRAALAQAERELAADATRRSA